MRYWCGDIGCRGVAILAAILGTTPVGVQAQGGPVLEEVVVTAQKREQRREDIGISLSVLGGEQLLERGITGLQEVAQATPSLDIFRGNGSDNPTITLRGVGTTNPWVNNNPSVAAHADGFYLAFSPYLTFPIFDLERIEVLKGPQIGLYGRNSTGGAINFVSARPTEHLEGYADVSYAEHDAFDARAAFSGPLSARARGRLAAVVRQGGGYLERSGTVGISDGFSRVPGVVPGVAVVPADAGYGDRDVYALRGTLEVEPTDALRVSLSAHYGRDDSELVGSTNTNGDRLGVFTPPDAEPFVSYDDFAPFTDSEQYGGVAEIDWRLGEYRLTSLTGYERLDRNYGIGDFVPLRIAESSFDERLRSIGQELRLAYEGSDTLFWLAGVQYTEDDIDMDREQIALDFLLGGIRTAFEQDDRSLAAFGQVEWRFAPQWLLTGSLRYTDEEKKYRGGSSEIDPFGLSVVGAVFPNLRPAGLFGTPEFSDEDLSGRVGLNWQPTDRSLLYASVSRAFKSGGFDGSGITEPFAFEPFGSETVWAYEVGAKHRSASGRLFAAGSAFYYDYNDQQVLALVDLGGGIVEAVLVNAAASEIYGVDLELNWRPIAAVTIGANGTYVHSEVTDWESADPAEVAARLGNELPGTPELMFTGSVKWTSPLGNDWTMDATLWGTYVTSAYRDIANTPELKSDKYGIVNARLELRAPGDRWSVYLFAHNLLDETYVTSVRSLVGMLGEYYGPPRSVGGGIRYEFGR